MSLDERTVVECDDRLTLRELRLWVHRGWIRPATGEEGPVFDEIDVARVRLICDLKKDMALPGETLPVVLNLIDHLHEARRDLACLAAALDSQPEEIRRDVLRAFRAQKQGTDT